MLLLLSFLLYSAGTASRVVPVTAKTIAQGKRRRRGKDIIVQ